MTRQTTLKDVAERAKVSFQTVSKVVNKNANVSPETEKRIWDAIDELNYHPNYTARSLRVQKTRTIGYSWRPSQPGRYNPILDNFLQGMFRNAERHGYYFLCFPFHEDAEKRLGNYRDLINSKRVDAFILSTVNYQDPCAEYLLEHEIPFYAFGRSAKPQDFPFIDVDGGLGLELAVNHLAELGHQHIGAIAWPEDSRVGNDRMEGYFRALREHSLPTQNNWIQRGEGDHETGYAAMEALLNLRPAERPSAVVCMNDEMAFGALAKLQERGLKPGKDMGVVGFDDVPAARLSKPSLTSLSQPADQIGSLIMERLITWLETDKQPDPAQELIPPHLVVRESTQP
ncbi:MAG: LacI family DNA-binding transcriptional regulator [Anaerolineaceae bacterium]|nr:LacI family DNA-binding transcriptional regulator [Anaerolineaceae bacterium]